MSQAEILGVSLGIAAIALASRKGSVAPAASNPGKPSGAFGSAMTFKMPPPPPSPRSTLKLPKGFAIVSGSSNSVWPFGGSAPNLGSGTNKTNGNAALDLARAQVKKEYDRLTAAGKKKGAAALNEKFPGLNLTGDEDFEEASKKIGAQAGKQGASAACAAYPPTSAAAPVCGVLGEIAGKYLGKELGPYLRDAWHAVEDWVEDKAGDAADAIKDAAGSLKFW